jgi:steroid delta-isomerase
MTTTSSGLATRFDAAAFMAAAEELTADTVDRLADFYALDCEFQDPFQTVRGRPAVSKIYRDMLRQLDRPAFTQVQILGSTLTDQTSRFIIGWQFEFALRGGGNRHAVAGCSMLEIDSEGRIASHIDYWDASRLMQVLPIVGPLIRWLRRKIGHTTPASP